MKRAVILTVILVVVSYIPVSATIIVIPGDYLTIQAGINASCNGDTVLVKPGIYEENINFNNHRIVLASMFLTTGSPEYIEETIIDGTSSGSVVTFENGEDSTTIIIGFTIRNGYAEDGGGIYCYNSNPIISNNIIGWNECYGNDNAGGGIYCHNSNPLICNNLITENIACWGGAICLLNSNSIISNNMIRENSADP